MHFGHIETTYVSFLEISCLQCWSRYIPRFARNYSTNELSWHSQHFRIHTLSIFPVKTCTLAIIHSAAPGFVVCVGQARHHAQLKYAAVKGPKFSPTERANVTPCCERWSSGFVRMECLR